MQLFLLEPVFGLGEKFEIVSVTGNQALDLLPKRLALRVTPSVLKRYEGLVKNPPPSQ